MANETVEILRIEFDADAAIKNTVELKKQRDTLRQTIKELSKDEAANAQEIQKLTVQTKVLSGQIREQEKVSENLIRIKKEEAGSNQALKAELSKLTSEYNRLSKEQRLTSERGLELKGRITDITNELKANESAIGNNFRNVGNYKSALEGIPGPIGNVTRGITGFNQTLKANPILAVVSLISLFGGALKKLQPITDAINVALGALTAVLDVTVQRFRLLLSGDIVGAFTGIGSAISDAAGAGAKYAQTQKNISDAQQIQNIQNAKAEKQIAVLTVQLKDRTKTDQERIAIANQITKIEQDNFNAQSKILKTTLSGEEQKVRALLRTAGVNEKALKTTEQLLEAAQERALQDESFKKLESAQIALTNAEKESLQITERAAVRQNAILDARAEKLQKAAEKKAQLDAKAAEEEEKRLQEIEQLRIQYSLTERERIIQSFTDKIKILNENNESEKKIADDLRKAQKEATDKFDADKIKAENEANQKIIDEKIKGINDQIALDDVLRQNELDQADLSIKNEEEKNLKKAEINLRYLKLQLANVQALADADGQRSDIEIANIEKAKNAIAKAQADIVQLQTAQPPKTIGELVGVDPEGAKKIDEGIQFAQQSLSNLVGIIKERYAQQITDIEETRDAEIESIKASGLSEEEKSAKIEELNKRVAQRKYELQVKQFNAEKALNLTNAIIAGATAVIKALPNVIFAGITAGLAAAQIAIIASQKPPAPPKFATGVVGLQGAGNSTSDSIPAMLSNGESVITASGTRFAETFYPGLLNFLNTKNKFADGVVSFQQPLGQSTNISIASELRAAIQDLTIVTKVSDIEKATFDRQSVRTVGVI